MRKARMLFLTLSMCVIFAACGGSPPATSQNDQSAPTSAAAQPAAATTAAEPAATAAEPAATAAAPAEPAATTAAPAGNAGAIKITVFAPQDPNTVTDITTNSFTKEMEQKFNVQFDWQTTTMDSASAKEKRQISLASGDYPALYLLIPWLDSFSPTDLQKYGQQGVVLPLNDLIEQNAPNIKAALDKYPTFKTQATAPDGKIYGLPQLGECYHCSFPNKMWINSAWLKKLNLQMPKTTEEFKAVLEAFKTKDPNGNGKADEVPLSGATEEYGTRPIPYLMNGFIYDDDRTFLLLKDGKVDIAANKPEWKEGLVYIKSLVDAGLIDPGAFTQNADAFKAIGDNANAELLGGGTGMHPAIFVTTGTGAPHGADYDAVPPLQGPHATFATYNYPSAPGATFVLTNKASPEAQVAAIKMIDSFFTQEGQLRSSFGEEGKDWRKPQNGDVAIEEGAPPIFATIPRAPGAPPYNTNWGALASFFQPKTFRDGWVQGTDLYSSEGYERRLQEATHLYDGKQPKEVFPHWSVWIDPAVADEAATLRTNVTDYVNQNALQFVTGTKDINTDWDAYVEGLNQLNLQRYLEIMQKSYDASAKK